MFLWRVEGPRGIWSKITSNVKPTIEDVSITPVMSENPTRNTVDKFILEEIDTVPHLEALLLLWNGRPREWSFEAMANAIYLSLDATRMLIADLERRGFVALTDHGFSYHSTDRDQLIELVDQLYRREIVRISNMIHSKPPASMREFARAFRLKRDRE